MRFPLRPLIPTYAEPAIALALLLTSALMPIAAAAIPAVSFESATTGCGPSNLEGWEFQTTEDLTVSALGAYDYVLDGFDHAIPVGIFDAQCQLVTSVVVPQGSGAPLLGAHRYVAITPLILPAGKTFRIAAVIGCDDFSPGISTLDDVVLHPALTGVVGKRIGFGDTLTCPTDMSSNVDFAANFIIGPPCGNGILQEGEQCDDGNAVDDDCCSNSCLPQRAGEACAADDEPCTADRCSASGACEHPPGNAGTACRAAAYACDAVETCDGVQVDCPEDEYLPDNSPCIDDDLYCTGTGSCFESSCTSSGDPCDGDSTCDEDADACVPFTPTATTAPTASATPAASATRTPSAVATATATRSPALPPTATTTGTPTGPPTATATGSPAQTPLPTETSAPATATRTGSPMRTPVPSETATPGLTPAIDCGGDCDRDGAVSINELITAVGIALGMQPLPACLSADTSASGSIEINELIAAVASALNGCF